MVTFSEREKAFETKYQLDQELAFKVNVRRNKLLGLWAAGLMGMPKDAAAAYAKEVVASDFEKPGDNDVLKKVLADFAKHNVDISEHRLRKEMDNLLAEAKKQIMQEVS